MRNLRGSSVMRLGRCCGWTLAARVGRARTRWMRAMSGAGALEGNEQRTTASAAGSSRVVRPAT